MILDNGEQVFLWLGARCSEVEIKLAYKSAQVQFSRHAMTTEPQLLTHPQCVSFTGVHSAHAHQAARHAKETVFNSQEQGI